MVIHTPLVVDVPQHEAEEDGKHCCKDKAGAIVGHIPPVALPEPVARKHSISVQIWSSVM